MGNQDIPSLFNLGICIKSKDASVEYQNPRCEEICGKQLCKVCNQGCILKLNAETNEIVFKSGFKQYRNLSINGNKVDCIVAQNGENIITFLLESQSAIEQQLVLIKKYRLSQSEINIMRLFLEGNKNSEIAEKLFISKSTLRTHLNNIYKKLPEKLKSDILDFHFKK